MKDCDLILTNRIWQVNRMLTYDYTVEVTNKFKELYLVDSVPEELWMEAHNIVQEVVTKTTPKKKICKKPKWLSEGALQKSREKEK